MIRYHLLDIQDAKAREELSRELLEGYEISAADGDANTMAREMARYPINDPKNVAAPYRV